jgi:hypothetical protein
MALEQLRLNIENLNEGMTPSMQKLQAQFQEDVVNTLAAALAEPVVWKQLSTAETKALWLISEKKPSRFAELILKKFMEKNS